MLKTPYVGNEAERDENEVWSITNLTSVQSLTKQSYSIMFSTTFTQIQ